jgi:threonine synthase
MVQLGPNHFLLELFHGPTLAFKDFAMQLIGQMMQAALARPGGADHHRGRHLGRHRVGGDRGVPGPGECGCVHPVPAWPGVRGAAPADDHALRGELSMRWPWTAISTTCQARVKDMFNDFAFRDGVRLAGVNSINWARVLAQVVYYFYRRRGAGRAAPPVSFTVPTGNFGDIFAGYIAKRMGLPIDKLVIATNQNDILTVRCGRAITGRTGSPSISPSMDIQVSSNFERALFDAYGRDGAAVAALMAS